jgi:protein-disulfide isomerase
MPPLLVVLTALGLLAALPAGAQMAAPAPDTATGGQSSPFAQSSAFATADREALHAEIRAYLLANPEILMEMLQLLEQKQQAATAEGDKALVAENAEAIFEDGFSWVGGNPEGSVTLVEFLDYQCGYCRKAQPELTELIGADGDIRLIVKEMPILGPGSELAARAAIATLITEGPESYAALHGRLIGLKGQITDESLDATLKAADLDPATVRTAMAAPEVDRRLAATRELAGKLAISGTPTFVFDDRMVRGYLPLDAMRSLVGELRAGD